MPRIVAFTVHAIDLPFRRKFEHAAASRSTSESLFVELKLDDGTIGWGESLPRPYVTGEARDGACELLATQILPHLLANHSHSFNSTSVQSQSFLPSPGSLLGFVSIVDTRPTGS